MLLLLFIESLLHTYGGQSQFPFSSRLPFSPSAHSHGGGVVGGGVVPGVVGADVGGVVALVVPVTVFRSVVPSVIVGDGVVGHPHAG